MTLVYSNSHCKVLHSNQVMRRNIILTHTTVKKRDKFRGGLSFDVIVACRIVIAKKVAVEP